MPTVEYILKLKDKYTKGITKADKATDKFDKTTKSASKSSSGFASKIGSLVSIAAVGAVFLKTAQNVMQYETNIASLSAITGQTGKALEVFESKIGEVAKGSKASSTDIAKVFEVIGSAKPELLSSADALGEVAKSAIVLAEASGMDLESAALSLTGAMNQFGLGADSANTAINVLANGAKLGAAAIPLVSQSIEKFGSVASGFNVSLEESVGLVESLADKSLTGAEAGTALRAMLSKMETIGVSPALKELKAVLPDIDKVSDASLPLQERMEALAPIANNAALKIKFFGETGKQAADIVLANTDRLAELTSGMGDMTTAAAQQEAQNNTLSKRLEQLGNAWNNIFTSSKQVTGVMGVLKGVLVFVTDNLETIVTVVGSAVAAFAAVKAAISTVTAVTELWSIASAILNGTLILNPVGIIIAAIIALVAVVVLIIVKWDEWGETIMKFFPLLGLFIQHWDQIKAALIVVSALMLVLFRFVKDHIIKVFNSWVSMFNSLIEGFKNVGNVIVNSLFGPFKEGKGLVNDVINFMTQKITAFLGILAKIPGVSDAINDVKSAIGEGVGGKRPKGAANIAGELPAAAVDPLARGPLSSLPTAGAKEDSLSGKGTTIKSAAPKTFNLTIGSLVEGGINITAANVEQSAEELKSIFTEMLLGSLNDTQENLA